MAGLPNIWHLVLQLTAGPSIRYSAPNEKNSEVKTPATPNPPRPQTRGPQLTRHRSAALGNPSAPTPCHRSASTCTIPSVLRNCGAQPRPSNCSTSSIRVSHVPPIAAHLPTSIKPHAHPPSLHQAATDPKSTTAILRHLRARRPATPNPT